ncbi:MAG TPA: hypothetical protein VEL76_21050 [Gemmataceae bacterium]|nr:hypothetical protein [Gemmataceae bacterium]
MTQQPTFTHRLIRNNRVVLFVTFVPPLGLLGCGSGTGPNPQGPASVKSLFTLDTGMMDVWGKKKIGPTSMALSPDGKLLLAMGLTKTGNVQVWDLDKQQKLHQFDDQSGTTRLPVAISPDGKTGAYFRLRKGGKIVLIDLLSGKEVRTIQDKKRRLDSSLTGMQFSPGGDLLIMACQMEIIGWDPATGNERFTWQDGARIRALSRFFEDGKKIASLNETATIKVWDVATGKPLQTVNDGNRTLGEFLAVSGDGKYLVSRGTQPIKFWDLPAGKVHKEVVEVQGIYPSIVILPDHRTVVWTKPGGLLLYDLVSGTKKQEVNAHEGHVQCLAVKSDGSLLLSSGEDAQIKGWKLTPGGTIQ